MEIWLSLTPSIPVLAVVLGTKPIFTKPVVARPCSALWTRMPLPSPPVALANYSQLIARRLGSLRRRPSALASRQTTHARPQHARLPLSRQRARVPRRPEEARAMEEARAVQRKEKKWRRKQWSTAQMEIEEVEMDRM